MTNREAYEAIRAHFTRPGARLAKLDDGQCVYRGTDTGDKEHRRVKSQIRCAVGVLIPDGRYSAGFEGYPLDEILDGQGWGDDQMRAILEGVDLRFLGEVQDAHDREARTVTEFVSLLDKIALSHGVITERSAT